MFLSCYPLFLVECKSSYPFFGYHNHRALPEPWKRERNIPWVAESKAPSSVLNITWWFARSFVCLLKLTVFLRKCVVTSRVIYPGRVALGYKSSRRNPNRNKTTHTRAFKIHSLDSSLHTAAASSHTTPAQRGGPQIASNMPHLKIPKQVRLKIRSTCWHMLTMDGEV